MSDAYRDEADAARARVTQLEEKLSERETEVAELRKRLGDQEAVFTRLERVVDRKEDRRSSKRFFVTGSILGVVGVLGGTFSLARAHTSTSLQTAPAILQPVQSASPPTPLTPLGADVCSHLGVRLTVAGDDAEAPAKDQHDLGGHKYRRDGSRAAFFTVSGGPLYVHAWGDFLPGDTGTTKLTMLDMMTKGETGGYRLARDGKSLLEVQGSDGKRIYGRFEADVSKVDDVTREAPFGTPVSRVRGTFCLPAKPANPSDTGP